MKRLLLSLSLCALAPAAHAWNWHGSVRAKAQVDNRYTHDAHGFGEAWSQFLVDSKADDLHGALDFAARTTEFDGGKYQKLYQGFIDKGFAAFDTRVRLGRFQRTDSLGFYLVDGGTLTYSPAPKEWAVEIYGGRPRRIDHFRSVEGDYLAGIEGRGHLAPGWNLAGGALTLDSLDLRGGYQYFEDQAPTTFSARTAGLAPTAAVDPTRFLTGLGFANGLPVAVKRKKPGSGVDRLSFNATAAGKTRLQEHSQYELGVLGTYRVDDGAFENALVNGRLDVTKWLRFRGSYEYYQPREPLLTFREKFYSAYALGEQTLYRGRVHLTPSEGFTYYLGGMRATRDGDDGLGGDLGASYRFARDFTLSGEFDYLELGRENARSGYASLLHTYSSRLQLKLNTALRYEHKRLYGENRAAGAEGEIRYMVKNNLILNLAGSYIWNTRLPDEYLGAVQIIYYFDHFQPKEM